MVEQKEHSDKQPENQLDKLQAQVASLNAEIKHLQALRDVTVQLGATLELEPLLTNLVSWIDKLVDSNRVLVCIIDDTGSALKFGAMSSKLPKIDDQSALEKLLIGIYNASSDPLIAQWLRGESTSITAELHDDSALKRLTNLTGSTRLFVMPLNVEGRLVGLLVVEPPQDKSVSETDQKLLQMIRDSVSISVENARLHSKMVEKLEANMHEMNILRQIDQELNDTIALDPVFNMTLDWALRFTNAHAASLALYEESDDNLRLMATYGYEISLQEQETLRKNYTGGITHRVARSGHSEVIPDIATDNDYIRVANNIKSQLAVPVMREDRVVAVMTLESKKLNGFTDAHVEFVQKLASRAAVAIDNARLFNETVREREKLSHILSNIADVVIVVGMDSNILLINQSALAALRLYPDKTYATRPFTEVVEHSALLDAYRRAKDLNEGLIEEITLHNERTYYTNLAQHEGIGWIIVMQDITPFKEMDKLKSELIATVSHDLKQPLSVMTGYLDLLEMKNVFDEQSSNFVNMIERSIRNMRQLIDDLLDLARIESGVELDLNAVQVKSILQDCIDAVKPAANNKSMTIVTEIPDDLPAVRGERARLRQIFDNLISNAVKYTPPEGTVKVIAEGRGLTLRVTVQDNGLGISPEDQAHIFDRFYRVRRPETDSIDGTGLGLAIVKTLVEAHHGKIGLESRLGEGSTFYVTLPTD
jgi:signal transduction histidine kinase